MSASGRFEENQVCRSALLGSTHLETKLSVLGFTPSPPHRSAGHVHPVFTEQAPHFIPPYFYSQSFLQVDFPPFYFLLLKFCLSRVHFKCHSTMKVPLSQLDVPSSSETGCV